MTNFKHIPVLLTETIEGLQVKEGDSYIDATIGGGGHTKEIVEQGGKVLGIDQDEDALEHVRKDFDGKESVTLAQGNFRNIKQIAEENGFEKVDGILFDLGVSSYQLDEAGRGFSFRWSEPLDMRMAKDTGLTAYDIVNRWSEEQLKDIFEKYGEEEGAGKIAAQIVEARSEKKIETTEELVHIVKRARVYTGEIHPATRVFMALRIVVNDELESIREGLDGAVELLRENGRLCVISFHSLEDRIIKREFQGFEGGGLGRVITKRPITASEEELEKNRRARSAKLRIFEKSR